MLDQKCPSCGEIISQHYCANCGEKRHDPARLSLRYFIGQLISAFTFSDSKFLRTFKSLIKNSGKLSAEYMDGKRILYTPPISMFLIANLIFFLFTPISTFEARVTNLNEGSRTEIWVNNQIDRISRNNSQSQEETINQYRTASQSNSKLLFIVLVFMLSLPLSILYFKQRPLYLAHLIFSLNLMTSLLFIIFIILPFIIFLIMSILKLTLIESPEQGINFDTPLPTLAFTLFLFIIIYRSSRTFYLQKKWIIFMKSSIVLFSLIPIIMGYRYLLLFVTLTTM